jgi:hypothetical protein
VFKRACCENEDLKKRRAKLEASWYLIEGKMLKRKKSGKQQWKAEKADLLDWLLAIDVCLT